MIIFLLWVLFKEIWSIDPCPGKFWALNILQMKYVTFFEMCSAQKGR